jgi:hypothetical protein
LVTACDSELERRFIRFLAEHGHSLPTHAQVYLAEANTRVDFLYQPSQGSVTVVFVDGPPHDNVDAGRRDLSIQEQLENVGYMVVRVHHSAPWGEVVSRYPSVFGPDVREPVRPASIPLDPEPTAGTNEALDELLELFEPDWHPTVRILAAHPGLSIDAGGELGSRVAAHYLAQIDHKGRTLFVVDAADGKAELALRLLRDRGDRAVALRPDTSDPLATVLHGLED